MSTNRDFRRLLLAMKDYIEVTELARLREADPCSMLDEAIYRGELPQIYYEILDELRLDEAEPLLGGETFAVPADNGREAAH